MRRIVVLMFMLLIVTALLPQNHIARTSALNGTVIEEDIVTDTKWDKAHSPYIIITSITVHENATLEIEPGVEVIFAEQY